MLAELPAYPLHDGQLGDLERRILMEHGVIAPPPGTRRIERRFSVELRSRSINDISIGRRFDALKVELQGRIMRALTDQHTLIPKPIPSVGATGKLSRKGAATAPVWVHARLRFSKPARRDIPNQTLVLKALCDAFTGPSKKWVGKGTQRQLVDAKQTLVWRDRPYVGGWLVDDGPKDLVVVLDFDPKLGDDCLTLTLVWDEPLGLGSPY